jgi:hypothetical protein
MPWRTAWTGPPARLVMPIWATICWLSCRLVCTSLAQDESIWLPWCITKRVTHSATPFTLKASQLAKSPVTRPMRAPDPSEIHPGLARLKYKPTAQTAAPPIHSNPSEDPFRNPRAEHSRRNGQHQGSFNASAPGDAVQSGRPNPATALPFLTRASPPKGTTGISAAT